MNIQKKNFILFLLFLLSAPTKKGYFLYPLHLHTQNRAEKVYEKKKKKIKKKLLFHKKYIYRKFYQIFLPSLEFTSCINQKNKSKGKFTCHKQYTHKIMSTFSNLFQAFPFIEFNHDEQFLIISSFFSVH